MPDAPPPRLHWGGPDRPARALRDLLEERVHGVPPGGAIDWATYYFRDRRLAEALIAASDRGVRVRVAIEAEPRNPAVNAAVLAMLRGHGLGGGLVVHRPGRPWLGRRPYLHAKVYAFSHPAPSVLVGSFNPSGDSPEDAAILADIGDQDRGHNLLAELHDPKLVRGLRRFVQRIATRPLRLHPAQNRVLAAGRTRIWLYPRLSGGALEAELGRLGPGDRLSGAISHLKESGLSAALVAAAARGAAVRLVVHDTQRRVPEAAVEELRASGAMVDRYEHPEALPLHAKFMLVERGGGAAAGWFGSFNFNRRSRLYNRELLVRTAEPTLVAGLRSRFEEIAAEL